MGFLFGFIKPFYYFCRMNPFIERNEELIELHLRKEEITSDIKKIEEKLKLQLEGITEVHKNLLNDINIKIKAFPKLCDHTDENGETTTSKEHKLLIPSLTNDTTLIRQVCSLCGDTVREEKYETKKLKTDIVIDWYQDDNEDPDSFIDTIKFNPDFKDKHVIKID